MIAIEEALRLIEENTPSPRIEITRLSKSRFRVLAEDSMAKRDGPPFPRVAMDGIALSFADLKKQKEFPIRGIQAAGSPQLTIEANTCVEVMTGAILPREGDTVIPFEQLTIQNNTATVNDIGEVKPGQNVHPRGLDFKKGDTLLPAGAFLRSPEIAVLASNGENEVKTYSFPRIALASTGDELVDLDVTPQPHQIWMSNLYALKAELEGSGMGEVTAVHLPDQKKVLKDNLKNLLENNDMVILSGGVSKGRFDYVPEVLSSLLIEKIFHRVSQRPGQPLYFGKGAKKTLVFGLPGNPVSSVINLRRYIVPALWRMMGRRRTDHDTIVKLLEDFEFNKPLTYFLPVKVYGNEAVPVPVKGSGDFKSLAFTDGFIELARDKNRFECHDEMRLFKWASR